MCIGHTHATKYDYTRITRIIQHLITIVIMVSAPSISKKPVTLIKKNILTVRHEVTHTIQSKQSETYSFLIILYN